MPGTYREVVCVPSTAPPITLYSTSSDASQTVIVYNNYAGKPKAETAPANPCEPNINPNPSVSSTSYQTYGTRGSATFAAYAKGFQAKNITFSNDVDESTLGSAAPQAVALITRGDQLVFENVRMLGNQDTLLAASLDVSTIARAYFKSSYIEGDVDFICGRATMVFDGGTIKFVNNRRSTGNILAASTDSRNPFGILISARHLQRIVGRRRQRGHAGPRLGREPGQPGDVRRQHQDRHLSQRPVADSRLDRRHVHQLDLALGGVGDDQPQVQLDVVERQQRHVPREPRVRVQRPLARRTQPRYPYPANALGFRQPGRVRRFSR